MDANEYNKYMEAVDMVCLHCVYDGNDPDAGEKYCDNCMVRKSVVANKPVECDILKEGTAMNNYPFEIADENKFQVVLKVNAKDAWTVAQHSYVSSNMAYISVSKGNDHILSVVNDDGCVCVSFKWGEHGYTLIDSRLEQLKKAVVDFISSQSICLDVRTMSYPTKADIFYNSNFECWQANLGFDDCKDEQRVFDYCATCAEDMLDGIKRFNPKFEMIKQEIAPTGIDVWKVLGF